jgi:hypothetical protein
VVVSSRLILSCDADDGEAAPGSDPFGSVGSGQSVTIASLAAGWSGATTTAAVGAQLHGAGRGLSSAATAVATDFSPCYIDETSHSSGSESSSGGHVVMVTMLSGASIGSHTSSGYIGDD